MDNQTIFLDTRTDNTMDNQTIFLDTRTDSFKYPDRQIKLPDELSLYLLQTNSGDSQTY